MKRSDLAEKFNPHHIPAGNGRESGRFTTGDGAGDGPDCSILYNQEADCPKETSTREEARRRQEAYDAKKPPDKGDPSNRPRLNPQRASICRAWQEKATEHGGFTEKNVDDIVANNKKRSNGVDLMVERRGAIPTLAGNTVIFK